MKKRSFRSTFVSVILVITVAISIVNLAVYGINIKKIRQVFYVNLVLGKGM